VLYDSRFESRQGVRGLSLLQNVHLGSGAPHSLLFSRYPGLFTSGSNGQGVKLIIRFHLILRLRITGAAPPLALCTYVPSTGTVLLWPSSWNCNGIRIHATDVLIFVYLLWSLRYRCFRCCDVYRRLCLVCHVLPEASWLCTTRLLVRIRVHALTVPLDCPLVAWEVVLNVEELFLGYFDVIKVRCLRLGFQQLVFAPVRCSQLHMVISAVECSCKQWSGQIQCKSDTTRLASFLLHSCY